ncbi:MAG TPA: hypothetical protein VG388_12160 [Solirubrobacteraceae bacterium]|nr:hypothetical protein [Solirubrobacteraceae bacterium]
MLLIQAGIGVAAGTWGSLAVLVVLPLAALLRRISLEEKVLLAAFGEPGLAPCAPPPLDPPSPVKARGTLPGS